MNRNEQVSQSLQGWFCPSFFVLRSLRYDSGVSVLRPQRQVPKEKTLGTESVCCFVSIVNDLVSVENQGH